MSFFHIILNLMRASRHFYTSLLRSQFRTHIGQDGILTAQAISAAATPPQDLVSSVGYFQSTNSATNNKLSNITSHMHICTYIQLIATVTVWLLCLLCAVWCMCHVLKSGCVYLLTIDKDTWLANWYGAFIARSIENESAIDNRVTCAKI